jgi:hypothetical protein
MNINSTTGLLPVMAAPKAAPTKLFSEMGVFRTRARGRTLPIRFALSESTAVFRQVFSMKKRSNLCAFLPEALPDANK